MNLGRSFVGFLVLSLMAGAVLWWGVSNGQAPSSQAAKAADEGLLEYERNTVEIVERYGDGVVYVSVVTRPQSVQLPPGFEFFAPFLQVPPQRGTGSGFVIDKEGYIFTNYHVVEGADRITVKFHNDPKEYQARLVGAAPPLDVALLKVDAPKERLVPLVLGDSDQIRVGQKAIAMGNPFGLEFTVTQGIVSAIRENPGAIGDESGLVPQVIQTDAAINPGNSGGALVDANGLLMGINTAIYSRSGGNMGIGFAVPVSTATQIMAALIKDGKVTRGWIGVEPRPLNAELAESFGIVKDKTTGALPKGVLIHGVLQNSPAAKAGIQPGDLIMQVAGQGVTDVPEMLSSVAALKPGEVTSLLVLRNGKTLVLRVTPGTRPSRP